MFLLLYILWIAWNGRITAEILILGLVFCALLTLFSCKFLGYSVRKEKELILLLPRIERYLANLLIEIIKANFDVAKIILNFKEEPEPIIVKFKTKLRSESARVVVANSITLTPGTYTVELADDQFMVHCLDKSLAEGIDVSSFVEGAAEAENAIERLRKDSER